MPGTGPKLIIVAKKEMIGEEMPDFDGDSFVDAKKKMMMKMDSKEEKPAKDEYSDDPMEAMKEMAKQLYKASKLHAGQADKIMEICEDMFGKQMKEEDSHSDDMDGFKAAGHNPHGKAKSMY